VPRAGTRFVGQLLLAMGVLLASGAGGLGDEPTTGVDDVTVRYELHYRPGTSKHCTLDLAVPKKRPDRALPAIVVIHGGGWVEGDKSSFSQREQVHPGNILEFARLGFVAASINYRMSGEAPWPVALDDCRCAVRYLRSQASEFGLDAARVGAWGNSAGGHLALLLGMMPSEPLDAGEPFRDQSSRVQAAVSDSGPIDLVFQHEQNELRTVIEKFLGGPPEGARLAQYRRASPASYATGNFGPLLLIYGAADEEVSFRTADDYVAALGRAGHPDVSYVRLAAVGHCPHSLVRIGYLPTVVNEFFLRTLAAKK
jgi:acetyl esterase/lipase